MSTKEVRTDDRELTQAARQLYDTRKALKLMEEQEKLLKDRVKELVTFFIDVDVISPTTPKGLIIEIGDLQVHLVEVEGRKTLNKDLLIDAGVLPSQIEKGYKKGEGYTKVEVKTL